jgi:glutamyl-tRNA synthetase
MMLGKGGAKLSKRHGAVASGEYRDQGILPEGLLNYLVRFGWGYGDQEIFTRAQLIECFDWSGCNKSDGRFDPMKLTAIAFEHLKNPELTSDEDYVEALEPFAAERFARPIPTEQLAATVPLVRPRAKTLAEAAAALDFVYADPIELDEKAKTKFLLSDRAEYLAPLRERIAGIEPWRASGLEDVVKAWAETEGIGLGKIAQPARVALTGKAVSPGIFEVMEIIGQERTLARLDAAIALRP